MQRIADRVYGILPCTGTADEESSIYRPPVDLAINSVRAELDDFANTQPSVVRQNSKSYPWYP